MTMMTRCDRCGACYEHNGAYIDVAGGYDLCERCADAFVAWVANDALPPENDVSGEQVDADDRNDSQSVTDGTGRVTETPELLHDTREKLEEDVRSHFWHQDWCRVGIVIGWLDRQAAITEREFFETACQGCERLGGEDDATLAEMAQRIQTLELEARKGEECRAKLGAVLDALHEAERAAK